MPRLTERVNLTINRSEEDGYHNEAGSWVEGETYSLPIKCNIQPYREGKTQVVLPKGLKSSDVVVIRTKTFLRTTEQFDNASADTTTIDGQKYIASTSANNNRNGLSLGHYKTLFVRQDRLKNGGL